MDFMKVDFILCYIFLLKRNSISDSVIHAEELNYVGI